MEKTRISKIVLGICLITLLLSSSIPVYAQSKPPHSKPGPVVDRIMFKAFAIDIAPAALAANEMDLYLFSLKTATAKELMAKQPDLKILNAPASSISIILNPAPSPVGELNPLQFKEVRFALQYMINRDYITGEIYRGLAASMTSHVSPLDYDYLTVYDAIQELNIHYDPDLAKSLIGEVMKREGATLKDGKWYYKGMPVRLKFIIRVEDERRDVGDVIATELEKIGFSVERVYQQFGPAIQKVYGSDPKVFEWHLYTEGWGRGSPEKYDYANLNQMTAPWMGGMPGWQETGYWQYENPELDALGKRIFMGEFRDLAERNSIYKDATVLGIKEAVRLWVATIINSFPTEKQIEGVTEDLVSGPRSLWTLREAYLPGKSELTVGNLWVWTERTIWNPVGGFGDVYSVDIWRNIADPPLWKHPFTGLPIPFRTNYRVETSGPGGKIDVPTDAFIWDAQLGDWRVVGSGVKTISKVTFDYSKYTQSKWHHGQPITMADILYNIYQSFDLTYNSKKFKIEFALATTSRPYLDTFRGFRIIDDHTLEVYVDYWHFLPDYIAEYSNPAGLSMPWEILYAMDNLVFEKRQAAYSDTTAEKFQVPWLSLVMEKDARLVYLDIKENLEKNSFPEKVFRVGGKSYLKTDEVKQRYEAAISWFKERKILVISNGPFKLEKFDPASQYAEITAYRDPSYPFHPGQWYFGQAEKVTITEVKTDPISIGAESTIEVKVAGPGKLEVKYLLFNPQKGTVVTKGNAEQTSTPNLVRITLAASITKNLERIPYKLILVAYSDQVSIITERTEIIQTTTAPPDGGKTTTTTTTTESKSATTTPISEKEPAGEIPVWLIAVAVLVAVVPLVIIVLKRRKK